MDGAQFRKLIAPAGLNIDAASIVSGGKWHDKKEFLAYLPMSEELYLLDGTTIPLRTLVGMAYIDMSSSLTLLFTDDTERTIQGGSFTARQKIELQSKVITATMPKMDSELNDLFPVLYPDFKNKAYYDVMKETEMIDTSVFDPSVPQGKFTALTDTTMRMYFDNVERRLKSIGCTGNPPSTQIRERSLLLNLHKQSRNMFKEWVLSHEWDGEHRIDTWFQNVFGATAPPLEQYGVDQIYLATVARAWFVGAIKRMFTPISHEIVPVLIGRQGICKKTSGLKYTAGKEEWGVSTTIDVSTKDGVLRFLDAVRGKVVVELAESSTIRSANQEVLKAFISNPSDQFRKPYAHKEEEWPRHFIMAASSNLDDVFTDITGNRRYYPMYCSQPDLSYRTRENVQQVWAEAYQLYIRGQPTYIDAAWAPAVIMQKFTTSPNSNVEMIDNWLNDPMKNFCTVGATITKRHYFELAYGIAYSEPIPDNLDRGFRAWAQGTQYWEKAPNPVKISGHKSERGYRRVMVSPEISSRMIGGDVENHMSPEDVEDINGAIEEAKRVEEVYQEEMFSNDPYVIARRIYRTICGDQNIYSVGTYFPVDDFDLNMLEIMKEEELIEPCDKGYYVTKAIGW